MSCAAVSGVIAISSSPPITRFIHTSSGMRPRCMPGQRIQRMVAIRLTAVPTLPNPETIRATVQ
jgi:hypothetical protein